MARLAASVVTELPTEDARGERSSRSPSLLGLG